MRNLAQTAGLAGACVLAAPAAQACLDPRDLLAARYEPVAVRSASNVATTAEARPPVNPGAISFRPDLVWHDGRTCADWTLEPESRAMVVEPDPMLSDAEVGPLNGPDHRLDAEFALVCRDLGGWTAQFRMVDRRTLVTSTPNGAQWLVFQTPLPQAELVRFQDQLRDMKFLAGPSSGELDEATRRAAAAYAEYRGAAYRFETPVVSENLLDLRPPAAN